MSREKEISDLCDQWINEATANGGIQIGANSERYRLRNNGIQLHELSFDELLAAGIGITKTLLLTNFNAIIDFDHLHFWSWSAEIILENGAGFFAQDEREIQELYDMLVRSSLAGIRAPSNDIGYRSLQQKVDELVEFNAKQLLMNRNLITAYLGFPLLEAVCKKLCASYVDFSGRVLTQFSAPQGAKNKIYTAGSRCSNLGHLLYLLVNEVADNNLKSSIGELLLHVEQFEPGVPGHQILFNWRNASLHGETSYPTIGGTLLSIITVICLYHFKNDYILQRDRIWQRIQNNYQFSRMTDHRSPWEYYPPY